MNALEAFRDILGILNAVSGCEVDMNCERIQTVTKELQELKQENKILKNFTLYCINEIHKWGCDYCGIYPEQEVINNISNYLNEKGIKEMLKVVKE